MITGGIFVKKATALLLTLVLCLGLVMPAMARTVTFGYYGYQPLEWLVLSSDSQYTKLITRSAVACRPFGNSTNWENSSLRYWLNQDFFWNAFNDAERSAICRQGNDYVRLASLSDVTNPLYGFAASHDAYDVSRATGGLGIALNEGLWLNPDNGRCSYYTLTPHSKTTLWQVRSDGRIGYARYDRDNVGVRPMIVVFTSMLP